MCFSSTASFTAGIVLTAVGVASIKKAKSKQQLMFAAIPFLFAVQQFIEGLIWLSFVNADIAVLRIPATYAYLSFAQVLWPVWVPLSLLLLSQERKYRNILITFTITGIALFSYFIFCLFHFPVSVQMANHHLLYKFDYPVHSKYIRVALYFVVTILPPLFSNNRKLKWLSAFIFTSYVLTLIFYSENHLSVWCFFAASISLFIWAIMHDLQIAAGKMAIEKAN